MEIGPISNRAAGEKPASQESRDLQPAAPAAVDRITDRVDISDEARARLGELADRELRNRATDDSKEETKSTGRRGRIAEIRERIEAGYYDDPSVRDEIIDRLIDEIGW